MTSTHGSAAEAFRGRHRAEAMLSVAGLEQQLVIGTDMGLYRTAIGGSMAGLGLQANGGWHIDPHFFGCQCAIEPLKPLYLGGDR